MNIEWDRIDIYRWSDIYNLLKLKVKAGYQTEVSTRGSY